MYVTRYVYMYGVCRSGQWICACMLRPGNIDPIRKRARTNNSRAKTNDGHNFYMTGVVALTSLWVIF